MNIVYVLISDEADFYYEQFLVSVISAKKRNNDSYVFVVLDSKTKESLVGKRTKAFEYVDRWIVVDIPGNMPKDARSRYIKTSLIKYINTDFLFTDCDTIFCSNLHDIEKQSKPIGAVLDGHIGFDRTFSSAAIQKRLKILDYKCIKTKNYYNSGVLLVRNNKDSKRFFDLWHELWQESYKKGILYDQPSFNEANYLQKGVLYELEGNMNCQIGLCGKYITSAIILHYGGKTADKQGGTNNYLFTKYNYLNEIKRTGMLNDKIIKVIDNPLNQQLFENSMTISFTSDDYQIIKGGIYSFIKHLYRRKYRLYALANDFFLWIRNRHLK